jgi:MoaA/NifB/PqqE/SkfB family radical SAM enzyme
MSDRNIIKKYTRSLCPQCYREIPASVIEEKDGVFMEKSCPDHGSFRAMLEKDASVYKALMNPVSHQRRKIALVIPITHRCNLRCKMCFFPDDGVPDPSQKTIFRLIDKFEGRIVFSGGEPTLRSDLPELISHAAKQGKPTCIATNGLRLHDTALVHRLAEAGLTNCLFSMNGLSDAVFNKIEGQPLLEKKLAGLQNLRGTTIKPFLSTTVLSGVNTNELPALADFYAANRDIFFGWRFRTQSAIGKHTDAPKLWMSDMLNLVCTLFRIDREKLLSTINPNLIYHGVSHLYFNLLSTVGEKPGIFGFRTIDQRSYKGKSDGLQRDMQFQRRSFSEKVSIMWHNNMNLLSSMSFPRKMTWAFYRAFHPSNLQWININIFAWPDIYNVDLDEMKQTGIYHVGPGGKPMPFVQAIILNEVAPNWTWDD